MELPPTPLDGDGERMRVLSSEYDRYCQSLLEIDDEEGWSSELRHYLKDRPGDVTKDTDIVKWWQVSQLCCFIEFIVQLYIRIMLCCSQHLHG